MGIGVDAYHAPEVERLLMPTPVQIQSPRIGINLNCNGVLGAGLKNLPNINIVPRPAEQLPTGHVSQYCRARVRNGPQDPIRLLLATQLESAVHARHDKIEARQRIVGVVQ
jgi:hypothetical protein